MRLSLVEKYAVERNQPRLFWTAALVHLFPRHQYEGRGLKTREWVAVDQRKNHLYRVNDRYHAMCLKNWYRNANPPAPAPTPPAPPASPPANDGSRSSIL